MPDHLEETLIAVCREPVSRTGALAAARHQAAEEGWQEPSWRWDVAWDSLVRTKVLVPVGRRWQVVPPHEQIICSLRERVATLEAALREVRDMVECTSVLCDMDGHVEHCPLAIIGAALGEARPPALDTYVCEWPGCFDPATSARRGAHWCDRHDEEAQS